MPSDLVKMQFLVAGTPVDALELVLHRSKASLVGRAFVRRLKDAIPRQQFEIKIQACVGSKVLASETLSAYRKDVTAGLYGGHYERKLKHLNKQKEGKKRLKAMSLGKVQVPHKSYVWSTYTASWKFWIRERSVAHSLQKYYQRGEHQGDHDRHRRMNTRSAVLRVRKVS